MVSNFKIWPAPEALSDFVRYFWYLEGEASAASPYVHRMTPTGCAELLCLTQGNFIDTASPAESFQSPDWLVSGQLDRPKQFELQSDFQIFGVCLYPYSLTALLDMDAISMLNKVQVLNADFVASLPTVETNEPQVLMEEVTASLTSLINQLPAEKRSLFRAIKSMVEEPEMRVNEIAQTKQLSVRQLQRDCKKYTAYTPKQLTVISRIQKALEGATPKSITQLAHELEYYDQAHFNNDFKRITGYTPKAFFQRTPESLVWHKQAE